MSKSDKFFCCNFFFLLYGVPLIGIVIGAYYALFVGGAHTPDFIRWIMIGGMAEGVVMLLVGIYAIDYARKHM